MGVVVAGLTVVIVAALRSRRPPPPPPDVFGQIARKVVTLLDALAADPNDEARRNELALVLYGAPVPFDGRLNGMFDHASRALGVLLARPNTAKLVERFFERFPFAPNELRKPLVWLDALLHADEVPPEFASVAERILIHGSRDEARWLYQRALELVQSTKGEPGMKIIALRTGRIAYSIGRPDGAVTIHDELAVANDLAARIA
jgi:hypothetical protein